MAAANDKPSGAQLDYGHEPSRWKRVWARIAAEFHERFDSACKSVGYFVGMVTFLAGGPRQLILAFGLAFLAGGFGLAIEGAQISHGHLWMWIGGFLIGLVIPIPKTGTGKL